mgnify:CR=1 FL=1
MRVRFAILSVTVRNQPGRDDVVGDPRGWNGEDVGELGGSPCCSKSGLMTVDWG